MINAIRRSLLKSLLTAPAPAGFALALRASEDDEPLINTAAEALDVFDFERVLEILQRELEGNLREAETRNVGGIDASRVIEWRRI